MSWLQREHHGNGQGTGETERMGRGRDDLSQSVHYSDGDDGTDWDGDIGSRTDTIEMEGEEPVRLPQKRRRQYMTFFTVLTMVIATASCILAALLLRGLSASNEANDARDQEVAAKLSAIEASLGTLDQSVTVSSGTAAANTAASYEELGETVDSLRSNLTDYRDNNDIQNEEIGDHLDRVIARLDRIKEDMSAQQVQEDRQDDVIGSRIDSLSMTSAESSTNLTRELEDVHQDIAALIDKAGNEQDGYYRELKGILTATDSSLSDLVADKFDETGELISSRIARLQGSVESVSSNVNSGLIDVNQSVDNGLSAVNSSVTAGLADIDSSLTNVSSNFSSVSNGMTGMSDRLEGLDNRMDSVADTVNTANDTMYDLYEFVTDWKDQNEETQDLMSERLETLGTDIDRYQGDWSERIRQMSDQIAGQNAQLQTLAADVQSLSDAAVQTQVHMDLLESRLDQILTIIRAENPDPAPDPDPDPEIEQGSDTDSSGEYQDHE